MEQPSSNQVEISHPSSSPAKTKKAEYEEALADIVASAFGSACCVYAGQPFDTIKVRMQLLVSEKIQIFKVLRTTLAEGGILALWRGSLPALTGQLLENPVGFATNGFLKRLFHDNNGNNNSVSSSQQLQQQSKSYFKPVLMGGITGFCTALVLCPCDVVKCRAQANIVKGQGKNNNIYDISKSIVQKNGMKGLWKGVNAQLFRDIPFNAAFFGCYDILCHLLKQTFPKWPDGTIYFVSGGLAGQIGWIASIVQDTIKSRIQVSEEQNLTIRRTFQEIITQQGYRGLFAGIEVAIIRAFPANAALFLGYEYSRKLVSDIL